ncbi:DMT family transporter [Tateyamaria sp. syn59]|uniref:DMT family transporter n=1 Tax=Tateyamaria sp. syn59 TaxID=2576942 RepID=UPI0016769820|nr:DMT family transporter [Tateyamaria sp. syn59]
MSRDATGIAFGLTAALMWSSFLIASRVGAVDGLRPIDMMVLRFCIAGVLLAPVLWWTLRRGASHPLTIRRSVLLALAAGPVFVWFNVGGFQFAPLAHGAVIQPATVALGGMGLAALWLGERLTRSHIVGAVLLLAGIAAIAGPGLQGVNGRVLIGDAMFVMAGLFWVAYTLLLKRWAVSGLLAAAVVSVLSALVVVPFAVFGDVLSRLSVLSPAELLFQAMAHGVFNGVGAIVAFGLAVERLGAARAALIPALIPATTLIAGLPITGERPTTLEFVGAAVACIGLVIALMRR